MIVQQRIRPARYAGVDVGGTHVRLMAYVDGRPTGNVAVEGLPCDYESFLSAVVAWIGEPVMGVGIGLPGHVLRGQARWIPNVPYLTNRWLADDIAERVGARVTLANDAQCALLGELRSGAARDVANVVLVSIGTGIGGAIAYMGRLLRGANGTAGAFGWLPVTTSGEGSLDPDAERGPWERLASGSALFRRTTAAGIDIQRLAAQEEATSATLVQGYLDDLAPGLGAIASALDPDRILLTGGVAELLAQHLPYLRSKVQEHASPVVRHVDIRVAHHGTSAGAVGAAYLAAESEGVFLT